MDKAVVSLAKFLIEPKAKMMFNPCFENKQVHLKQTSLIETAVKPADWPGVRCRRETPPSPPRAVHVPGEFVDTFVLKSVVHACRGDGQ